MTSKGITLQDKIDALKKKKEQENESNHESNENKELETSIEVLNSNVEYLIDLIESNQNAVHEKEENIALDISAEPFKTLNRNDHLIYKKVKNLGTDVRNDWVELHQQSLDDSLSRLEKQYKAHEKKIDKILKLKAYSSVTVYFIATVLLALILARVAIYGIWEGLGLSQLYSMSEWYFQLLGVGILLLVIIGVFFIVINGVENIRRNYF